MTDSQKELLEDVLKYLIPHMKFTALSVFSRKEDEIAAFRKNIREGLQNGVVKFFNNSKYDINLKFLEKKNGKEWVNLLKKQLSVLESTLDKVRI